MSETFSNGYDFAEIQNTIFQFYIKVRPRSVSALSLTLRKGNQPRVGLCAVVASAESNSAQFTRSRTRRSVSQHGVAEFYVRCTL